MEAELDLPRFRLQFAFPGDDYMRYEVFARWTVDKLKRQQQLVVEGLPGASRKAFDLLFEAIPAEFVECDDRKHCPQSALRELEQNVVADAERSTPSKPVGPVARPNQCSKRGSTILDPSPIADGVADLFADVFRSLNTQANLSLLRQAYVMLPHNERIIEIIAKRILEWVGGRLNTPNLPFAETEPRRKIQFLTGGTGVGKSTLLKYLLDIYLPDTSELYKTHCFWCIVDCIGKKSTAEVLRATLRGLSWCAQHSIPPDEIKSLEKDGVLLRETVIPRLSEDQCREQLILALRALQFPKEVLRVDKIARFVILAFDNVDRITSLGVTSELYDFCVNLAKETRTRQR